MDTGYFYNHNHFYNPELGRYIEPDQIGLQGGLNPYAYAGNNPVMNSDSRGLCPLELDEKAMLAVHFGNSLDSIIQNFDIKVQKFGDRALSLNGGNLYFPKTDFIGNNPTKSLNLADPYIAAKLGHEILHQLQREVGINVTLRGLILQPRYSLVIYDPYKYQSSLDPQIMLDTFKKEI